MSFKDNVIQVGKVSINEGEDVTMLTWNIPSCQIKEKEEDFPAKFTHFAIATRSGAGSWKFEDDGNRSNSIKVFRLKKKYENALIFQSLV